jgi:protein phosphatase
MKPLKIPELCLVVLVGTTGSGKSTFAARHFLPTEVVSSDFCRGLVSDDENDQSATTSAFEVLHLIVGKRLEAGRLSVVDATSVQVESRRALIELAKQHHALAVAVVLDLPAALCAVRNESRPDRQFGPHVLRNQRTQLQRSMKGLRREGFHRVYVLSGEDEIAVASFERERLWNDGGTITVPSTSSGTCTGVTQSSSSSSSLAATRSTEKGPRPATQAAGGPFSLAISWIGARLRLPSFAS